jgi:hypothetical protein
MAAEEFPALGHGACQGQPQAVEDGFLPEAHNLRREILIVCGGDEIGDIGSE